MPLQNVYFIMRMLISILYFDYTIKMFMHLTFFYNIQQINKIFLNLNYDGIRHP